MLCSEPIQRRRPSAASTKGGGLRPPPFVVSFVLALSKAHVLALNTAHVLRLNKADVLALNKAHVLHLNTKICPVLTANTKEAAFGRLHKGGAAFGRPPFVVSFVLAVSTGHILVLRCKTCALLRAKTSALLRRKTCAVLRPLPKIRPDLSPARPDVSSDRKSMENLRKIENVDQKTTFSIAFCKIFVW